jgi:AmiR/NasT family two-component response regulator
LSSFDFIEIVGRMTGERIRIEEVLQIQPDVLLIDCFSKTHCTELLNLVHTRPFHMKCIAITDGFQTSKLVMEQGVDAALIKGFTRKDLQSVLSWTVFNNRESKIDLTEGRHRHDQ